MKRLEAEDLKRILLHDETGVIKQKQEIFKKDGLELIVDDDVYDLLAQKMYEENLGARSARNIVEDLLGSYSFDMLFHGYKKIRIHAGVITRKEEPYFERGDENETENGRNTDSRGELVRLAV